MTNRALGLLTILLIGCKAGSEITDTAETADTIDSRETTDTSETADTVDSRETADTEEEFVDNDDDGFPADDDCDDDNASVNPNAAEICDGVDNNCDATVDYKTYTLEDVLEDNGFSEEDLVMHVECTDPDPPDLVMELPGKIITEYNEGALSLAAAVEDAQLLATEVKISICTSEWQAYIPPIQDMEMIIIGGYITQGWDEEPSLQMKDNYVVMQGVTFIDARGYWGGGFAAVGGTIILNDVQFDDNLAIKRGGAMYLNGVALWGFDVYMLDNWTKENDSQLGGTMYMGPRTGDVTSDSWTYLQDSYILNSVKNQGNEAVNLGFEDERNNYFQFDCLAFSNDVPDVVISDRLHPERSYEYGDKSLNGECTANATNFVCEAEVVEE